MEAHESFVQKNPKHREHFLNTHLSCARSYLKLIEQFIDVQSKDPESCYGIQEGILEKKGKEIVRHGFKWRPTETVGSGNYSVYRQYSAPWSAHHYMDTIRDRLDLAMYCREALIDYTVILQAEKDGYEFPANGLMPVVSLYSATRAKGLLETLRGVKKSYEDGTTKGVRILSTKALLPTPATPEFFDTVYQALFQRYHNVLV